MSQKEEDCESTEPEQTTLFDDDVCWQSCSPENKESNTPQRDNLSDDQARLNEF